MQTVATICRDISLPPSGRWCPENEWLPVCRKTLAATPGLSGGARKGPPVVAELSAARRPRDRAALETSLSRAGGDLTWPDPLRNLRYFESTDESQGLVVARAPGSRGACGYSHILRGLSKEGSLWVYELHLAMVWVSPRLRGRGIGASMCRGILWQFERDLREILSAFPAGGKRHAVMPMLNAHPVTFAGMHLLEALSDGAEWVVRHLRAAVEDGDLPPAKLRNLEVEII